MRHQVKSARLNRSEAHLSAMVKNMISSIILYEKIQTTASKAKFVKPIVERLISRSKKQSLLVATRQLNGYLSDKNATKKLLHELIVRYKDRQSGFLRVIPLGSRQGDAAPIVRIEFV
jgi:large subunit ribosomal protein L17